jgi:rhodanese-related sulfurtransferase
MVTWTGLFFCTRGEAMIGHDACRVFIFRLMRPIMLLLAIPLAMGFAHASAEVRDTTVVEAVEFIEDGIQLLDVRTEVEWNAGRIKGATRIGIAGDGFAARAAKELDPSKPVLVYCRSGNRSAQAARKLEKLGFKTIYDLKGGIKAWLADGRTVIK